MTSEIQAEANRLRDEQLAKRDSAIAQADAKTRKALPLFSGVLRYFPDALLAVAELSRIGNDQHNPGQPLHWSRGKSNDHHDCLARHLVDAGTVDVDKVRHSTKVAWRALAALQLELEALARPPEQRSGNITRRRGIQGVPEVEKRTIAGSHGRRAADMRMLSADGRVRL